MSGRQRQERPLWPRNRFEAIVTRVVDGDTVDLEVDLGFHVQVRERFRLAGIDAPEPRGSTILEGRAATAHLRQLLPEGATVWVSSQKQGSFRRWLGHVFLEAEAEESVSELMVEAGHAVRYER